LIILYEEEPLDNSSGSFFMVFGADPACRYYLSCRWRADYRV